MTSEHLSEHTQEESTTISSHYHTLKLMDSRALYGLVSVWEHYVTAMAMAMTDCEAKAVI